MALRAFLVLLGALAITVPPPAAAGTEELEWGEWSTGVFARAKAENRFVLLDLGAVWCHWCHVMEETTYRDPAVVRLIRSRYLPVRVDQDANPELSNRYEDYGWPATIVFAPDGTELAKRRGYIPPEQFAALLQAFIDDPKPGPSVVPATPVVPVAQAALDPASQRALLAEYFALYDDEHGGWGTMHKFMDADSIEYALRGALNGDARLVEIAKRTLDAATALIDPVWGGVYQYSVGPTWNDPHFEKIMSFQASYLRAYSLAFGLWHDEKYRKTAQAIIRYLTEFLMSPDGVFYASQDADAGPDVTGKDFYAMSDDARRKVTMPRVDRHVYARENGWAITAFALYANITDDKGTLDRAIEAARFIIGHHALPDGGFRHDADQAADATPHLGDSLYMAQAFATLYAATAEREWLDHAARSIEFISRTFMDEDAGFIIAPVPADAVGVFKKAVRQVDENVTLARTANLLFHYTGNARHREMAGHAMRYLAAPALLESRRSLPGVLLTAHELSEEPLHITVVGKRNDASARVLYAEALRWPAVFKRIEWWDRSEGPLPNPDIQYPQLDKAAIFLCTNKTCSLPMYTPEALTKRLHAVASEDVASVLDPSTTGFLAMVGARR
ncbi:MAG: DUF255 domain-containing protein [Pseudomonadota bacterium]|nr:DUF255 domain-containing protein [Pseudomonadota bacterium]